MAQFFTHYFQALSTPAVRLCERFAQRTQKSAYACTATVNGMQRENAVTRAEQLEHISAYARAGYFNMGYTVDAFQLPEDSAQH